MTHPPEPLTAKEEAEVRHIVAMGGYLTASKWGKRLLATLDAERAAREPLHYVPVWREWEKFEDKAAKQGSGANQEQMTGAAMMLGWLIDTYLPALAPGSAPAESKDVERLIRDLAQKSGYGSKVADAMVRAHRADR